jgi:hypothetical protein
MGKRIEAASEKNCSESLIGINWVKFLVRLNGRRDKNFKVWEYKYLGVVRDYQK